MQETLDRLSRQRLPPRYPIEATSASSADLPPDAPDRDGVAAAEVTFRETPSSLVRVRAATLLRAASPTFATTLAFECLWDCERETRDVAVASVDRTLDGAQERVDVLANDPDDVHD